MSELLPAEKMVLTIARAQLERGENPPINMTAMLVHALERITGGPDWTKLGGDTPDRIVDEACAEAEPA